MRRMSKLQLAVISGVIVVTLGYVVRSAATTGAATTRADQQESLTAEGVDFSKFLHSNRNHARLPCLLCHLRESNSPQPLLPGRSQHAPCAGCHEQQFSKSDSPICTICHTDVKSGALKPFPRLKSFNAKFDHSRHVRMQGLSCATCHRSSRGGVALSIPAGFNAHVTCYRCHTPRAQSEGRDISSCSTCHQLGSYRRTPEFASAFRVGFSHAKHQKVTCNECHQIRTGMAQQGQVTAPVPLHHHAGARSRSCMSCHNGKRAFGGDDFSVCKRCHTGTTWRF